MVLRKSFYIRWSAGRSRRVHEVNPGRDPSFGLLVHYITCMSRALAEIVTHLTYVLYL